MLPLSEEEEDDDVASSDTRGTSRISCDDDSDGGRSDREAAPTFADWIIFVVDGTVVKAKTVLLLLAKTMEMKRNTIQVILVAVLIEDVIVVVGIIIFIAAERGTLELSSTTMIGKNNDIMVHKTSPRLGRSSTCSPSLLASPSARQAQSLSKIVQ